MDSDVFRKLCFGVRFKRPKPLIPQVNPPGDVQNTDNATEKPEEAAAAVSSRKRKKKKKQQSREKESKEQEINAVRNSHRIHVSGPDVPEPVTDFSQLSERYKVHNRLLLNVTQAGFHTPTPVQMQAIPVMMERRDVMVCAPTGSGKTAAFVVPVLHHLREPRNQGFRAVLLAPTRELAKQTLEVCRKLSEGIGFRCHYIDKATKAVKFGPKSKKNFDVLVSTPNRLVFMLQQEPPLIDISRTEWLIVDESDKLFEEGIAGFREQLATIYNACSSANIRRALFSATYAQDVKVFCRETMESVIEVSVGSRNTAARLVQQELLFVGSESGKRLALRDMIRKGIEPPVLIFVQSKERAMELFSEFMYDNIMVDVIHADRTQLQRDNTVRSFEAGKVWVLVCTELMGRGIDFKGVNLVLNYDFPTTAVSYIHRIGRTGRAGHAGKAVTFFTEDDVTHLRSIANIMREAGCEVPPYMLKLKKPTKAEKKKKIPVKRKRISTEVYEGKSKKRKKQTKKES